MFFLKKSLKQFFVGSLICSFFCFVMIQYAQISKIFEKTHSFYGCNQSKHNCCVLPNCVQEMSGNSDINFIVLDLADLQSVRKCAKEFEEKYGILNVLMNNAGVMAIPQRQVTADGFEKQFGINHLGCVKLS